MECIEARKYISLYIDGEIDDEKRRELLEHMKTCSECASSYDSMKSMDSSIKDIFCDKKLPEGFEEKIMNNLPERKESTVFHKLRNKAKPAMLIPVLTITAVLIILWMSSLSILNFFNKKVPDRGTGGTMADLAAMIRLNDVDYLASDDVVADERIIGGQIGKITKSIADEHSNTKITNGSATILPVGTTVYSINDMNDAIAVKYNGKWEVYKKRGTDKLRFLFNDDYANAEKIIISYNNDGKESKREITDRNTITAVVKYLKSVRPEDQAIQYSNQNTCSFYFYIKDGSGIGKIVPSIMIVYNDPKLGGYISYDHYYKVTPEVLKLFVPGTANTGYDVSMGGAFQIYDAYLSPKFLIRRFVKDENGPKAQVKVIKKDEKIWSDGKLINDTLSGNYKLMVLMRGTTIQNKAAEKIKSDYKKIPGAVSISISKGETDDTTVIYIGFDKIPNYKFDEFGESIMILMNGSN
ncbi:MAG: anti-sigma factor [Clostridiales bacterium]|nr:anti-sigma factor [Clostridiales bacterium]